MSEPSRITIDLTVDERRRLEAEAERRHADVQDLVREAVDAYLNHDAWMTAEIQQGLAEADADDIASDDTVQAVFDKWRN